jgi:hypothetical protein
MKARTTAGAIELARRAQDAKAFARSLVDRHDPGELHTAHCLYCGVPLADSRSRACAAHADLDAAERRLLAPTERT